MFQCVFHTFRCVYKETTRRWQFENTSSCILESQYICRFLWLFLLIHIRPACEIIASSLARSWASFWWMTTFGTLCQVRLPTTRHTWSSCGPLWSLAFVRLSPKTPRTVEQMQSYSRWSTTASFLTEPCPTWAFTLQDWRRCSMPSKSVTTPSLFFNGVISKYPVSL